jgi:hypothetical protein
MTADKREAILIKALQDIEIRCAIVLDRDTTEEFEFTFIEEIARLALKQIGATTVRRITE